MGAAHKGRNDVIELLVQHGANLETRDSGSRDSIQTLAGVSWPAIDYADDPSAHAGARIAGAGRRPLARLDLRDRSV
jgi:hypothetical protein